MGLVSASQGTTIFNGLEITRFPPWKIARKGIALVPERRRIFPEMTILENLLMGAFQRHDSSGVKRDLSQVYDLFPILQERERQSGGTLSGGEQQVLALGRALMAHPDLILFDEASMGLAPAIVDAIFRVIRQINESGTTILMVEQNAAAALEIADRAYILQNGHILSFGAARELARDREILRKYLGAP